MMIRFRPALKFVTMFAAILGLTFVIGCGSSSEKQAMTEFLQEYSHSVDEYSSANQSKLPEIKGKLDSYDTKWTDMKIDFGGTITPQTLNELDKEYKNITKRYAALAKKS